MATAAPMLEAPTTPHFTMPDVAAPQATKPPAATTPCKKSAIHKLIWGEALLGSILILAAPFLGEWAEPVGGSKVVAIVLAVCHYAFHFIGGAVLFKAGLDMGKHSHHHSH